METVNKIQLSFNKQIFYSVKQLVNNWKKGFPEIKISKINYRWCYTNLTYKKVYQHSSRKRLQPNTVQTQLCFKATSTTSEFVLSSSLPKSIYPSSGQYHLSVEATFSFRSLEDFIPSASLCVYELLSNLSFVSTRIRPVCVKTSFPLCSALSSWWFNNLSVEVVVVILIEILVHG